MNHLNEAAVAANGGNPVITFAFWLTVAFTAWLIWTGKYKLIFAAANPTGTALSLASDAVEELLSRLANRGELQVVEETSDVSSLNPESFVATALDITEGLPDSQRIAIIREASKRPADTEALLRDVNRYLLAAYQRPVEGEVDLIEKVTRNARR